MEHFGLLFQVLLGVLTVLMITLLSWGIAAGSFVAAMVAGGGMAAIILVATSMLVIPENLRSSATERTLRLASQTLSHMQTGLSRLDCEAVCKLLLPETRATGIAMTDLESTLAYVGDGTFSLGVGSPNTAQTLKVIESGRMQTFESPDRDEWQYISMERAEFDLDMRAVPVGVIVPLVVSDNVVGTIKLYYRYGRALDRTQIALARGFAELLSTQLSSYELDRQAELAALAEVKALQAQINPHFLFNTLNTIAAFTRTDPTKARDLLREFSVFYRRTLQSTQSSIALAAELDQTRRYLNIERARFGQDRIVEIEEIEEGCEEVMVPGFLIQPIVENSVRHAMGDEDPLHIRVEAHSEGDDVVISVADDGLGMDEDLAGHLLNGVAPEMPGDTHSSGVALHNVEERVKRFFGPGSGVQIESQLGEGTRVTIRLANVLFNGA